MPWSRKLETARREKCPPEGPKDRCAGTGPKVIKLSRRVPFPNNVRRNSVSGKKDKQIREVQERSTWAKRRKMTPETSLREPFIDACGQRLVVLYQPKRVLFRPKRRLRQPEKALRWPEITLCWPKKQWRSLGKTAGEAPEARQLVVAGTILLFCGTG